MRNEGLLVDINYFDEKTTEQSILKKKTLLNEFRYSRQDFFLVEGQIKFFVCISKDGELYCVWYCWKDDKIASEAISEFRNGFERNKIDEERITLFLENPKKYKRKYLKKK